MRFTPADLPDLSGKVAIVTGANSGIGFHAADELARRGATVVLACRNTEAADLAAAKIPGETRVEKLDVGSQASVAAFADRWSGPIDLLINNAGLMRPPTYQQTVDGHELQFGTNHLGHFALTGRLLPALAEAPSARVVTIASIAHLGGDARVVEGNPKASYQPAKTYSQSKLANLMFALELHERLTATGSRITSTAAHPGVSSTGLFSSTSGMGANPLMRHLAPIVLPLIFQSSEAGTNPTLYAATQAEPGTYTGPQLLGESRGPLGPAKINKHALDPDLRRRLWERSEELTGVTFSF